ncbi:MAG: hypothetical protein QM697_00360 [Lachnospiraceae bacterium]
MQKYLKIKSLHFIGILVFSIIIGYLLLVLVYMIPSGSVLIGCANSIPIFQQEGTYPIIISGYQNSQLDNYTDGAMFNNVIYSGQESPFVKAAACFQYRFEDENPMESFLSYLWMEEDYSIITYSRYWHGFLVILKPLLIFMNYADVRVLNGLFQALLLAGIVWQLVKNRLERYILPMLLTVFYLVPMILAMSLQYSSVYNIALAATLFLLIFHEKIDVKDLYAEFFLVTGILTSYFDLLTYPLITLGFPLIFITIMKQRKKKTIKSLFLFIAGCSFSWGVGYVGMWMGKWIIAVLVLGIGTFSEVAAALQSRSLNGAVKGGISLREVIQNNFKLLERPIYKMIPSMLLLYHAFQIIARRIRPKELAMRGLPFLFIISMPFFWYLLTADHANVHSWFTYRTLSIAILGFFSMLTVMSEKRQEQA